MNKTAIVGDEVRSRIHVPAPKRDITVVGWTCNVQRSGSYIGVKCIININGNETRPTTTHEDGSLRGDRRRWVAPFLGHLYEIHIAALWKCGVRCNMMEIRAQSGIAEGIWHRTPCQNIEVVMQLLSYSMIFSLFVWVFVWRERVRRMD